jgi:hypothetical protein
MAALSARRAGAIGDELAYGLGVGFGALLLLASGYLDRSAGAVRHNDFARFWAGPHAFLAGADPFDASTWAATSLALGNAPDAPIYHYPGWALVLLLPFGALPVEIASAIWTFGSVLLAVVAVRALLREFVPGLPVAHTLVGMSLLASQPARLTALEGQWGFLLVAASAAIVLWVRAGRISPAAMASLALLGKPHLFTLSAPAVAVWSWAVGRRRFAAVAAAACLVLVATSVLLLPDWPAAWLREMPSRRLFDPPQTTTLAVVLYGLLGSVGPWLAVAIVAACILLALGFPPASDAWLAVWLTLSPMAALYIWSYDHLLFIVPLAIAIGVAARRSRGAAVALAVAGGLTLTVGTTLLAIVAAQRDQESYNALVPPLLFVLVVATLWPERRRAPETAPAPARGYGGGTA